MIVWTGLVFLPSIRHKGHILKGQGKAIEYAVKMRRLPQEAMAGCPAG